MKSLLHEERATRILVGGNDEVVLTGSFLVLKGFSWDHVVGKIV